MKIAAAVCENSMDAVIPLTLEQAVGLLIFDLNGPDLDSPDPDSRFVTENPVKAMVDEMCEALLCGVIYDGPLFEAIADAGITRYNAAGMTVREAIPAMNRYELGLIRDYVNGPGCGNHGHTREKPDCGGSCASCEEDCEDRRDD